jgi:hypothetical protein
MGNDDIIATLQPQAKSCALKLLIQFPFLTLTSGLRTPDSQAQAMATDVVKGGIAWLVSTYANNPVKSACVAALTALQATSLNWDLPGISACLLGVFAQFTPLQLMELDLHMSGMAFDIEPLPSTDSRTNEVVAAIEADIATTNQAGGDALFLPKEGNLLLYHVQIKEPA